MSALGERLARGGASLLVARTGSLIVGLLLSPYLLARLGESQFGIWALAFAVGNHANIFSEFGTGLALTWRVAQTRSDDDSLAMRRAIGAFLLVTGSAGFALVLLASVLMDSIGLGLGVEPRLILVAVAVACSRPLLNAWDLVLQGLERFDTLAPLSVARSLLWGIAAIIAVESGGGVVGVLLAEGAAILLLLGPGIWFTRRAAGGPLLALPRSGDVVALTQYGRRAFIAQLADLSAFHSDKIATGASLTPLGVKAYELAQKMAYALRNLIEMLARVLLPAVPGILEERGPAGLTAVERRLAQISLAVLFPAFAALAVLAPEILGLWLGPQRVGAPMILALRGLAAAHCFGLISQTALQTARGMGRLEAELKGAWLLILVGLPLRIAALVWLGFPGLIGAAILVQFSVAIAQLVVLRRTLPEVFGELLPWRGLARPIVVASASSLAVLILVQSGFLTTLTGRLGAAIRLSAEGFLFAATFGILAWTMGLLRVEIEEAARPLRALAKGFARD